MMSIDRFLVWMLMRRRMAVMMMMIEVRCIQQELELVLILILCCALLLHRLLRSFICTEYHILCANFHRYANVVVVERWDWDTPKTTYRIGCAVIVWCCHLFAVMKLIFSITICRLCRSSTYIHQQQQPQQRRRRVIYSDGHLPLFCPSHHQDLPSSCRTCQSVNQGSQHYNHLSLRGRSPAVAVVVSYSD